jgi:hypothetical protein
MRESTPRLYHSKNQCFAALSYSKKEPADKDLSLALIKKQKNWFWPVLGGTLFLMRTDAFGSS